MSQQLISRNPVLQQLQAEGYELQVHGGYLIIRYVPYINAHGDVVPGTLAMPLTMAGNIVGKPSDHTAFWCDEEPRQLDGTVVSSLINSPKCQAIMDGLETKYYLSCHLEGRGYNDYHEKVCTYCNTISGPALAKDPKARERFKPKAVKAPEESPFHYMDTNSSRAGITGISGKLQGQKVAIVGMGGTGAYLLDFLAKVPLSEIHIYDGDEFMSHNAFRAPGAPTAEVLETGQSKVTYLTGIYSSMHKNIIPHNEKITKDNLSNLDAMDMVFIAVDSVNVRNLIAGYLIDKGKHFIDSGLGLDIRNNAIGGQIRLTAFEGGDPSYVKDAFGTQDIEDDVYAANIQIAELNALAAILMVIKWKKSVGFYPDDALKENYVYNISSGIFLNG